MLIYGPNSSKAKELKPYISLTWLPDQLVKIYKWLCSACIHSNVQTNYNSIETKSCTLLLYFAIVRQYHPIKTMQSGEKCMDLFLQCMKLFSSETESEWVWGEDQGHTPR